MSKLPHTFLGLPHNGWIMDETAAAFYEHPTARDREVIRLRAKSSVLESNFNELWAAALNARKQGFTRFVMLHSDVAPDPYWVDVLDDEMDRTGAGVVSAVVPMKSVHAITSTALGWGDGSASPFTPIRRLTMREVFQLPETFSREDVSSLKGLEGGPSLFINTGCWMADLAQPWVEKVVFRNVSRMVRLADGTMKANCLSEDWAFSCDLARWGVKVCATRKVKLFHDRQEFHNKEAWGAWTTDNDYLKRVGEQHSAAA